MGIPRIAAYAMPEADELPPAVVTWLPDASRSALLIHDMQRYFIAPFTPGESPVRPLIDNIRAMRAAARKAGIPVFYTAQPGNMTRAERGLLHDFWGAGMSDRPEDNQIIDELAPDDSDVVLAKWKYSAFIRSDLEQQLASRGRDQLIVSGVYAHVGCLITACDAFSRDIETFFVADAVADFTLEYHRQSLRYAAERCATPIMTDRLVEALTTQRLCHLVALVLDVENSEVSADALFYEDLGMDSFQKTEIVAQIEQDFGAGLTAEQADSARSVTDLVAVLSRRGVAEVGPA